MKVIYDKKAAEEYGEIFYTLKEAQVVLEMWWREYYIGKAVSWDQRRGQSGWENAVW